MGFKRWMRFSAVMVFAGGVAWGWLSCTLTPQMLTGKRLDRSVRMVGECGTPEATLIAAMRAVGDIEEAGKPNDTVLSAQNLLSVGVAALNGPMTKEVVAERLRSSAKLIPSLEDEWVPRWLLTLRFVGGLIFWVGAVISLICWRDLMSARRPRATVRC